MLTDNDLPTEMLDKWGQAIKNDDAYALQVQQYVADKLAPIVATAINCYDPQVVILAGYVCMQCFDHLAKAIRQHITTDVFDNLSRQISIIPAKAGEKAIILGTARPSCKKQLSRCSDFLPDTPTSMLQTAAHLGWPHFRLYEDSVGLRIATPRKSLPLLTTHFLPAFEHTPLALSKTAFLTGGGANSGAFDA